MPSLVLVLKIAQKGSFLSLKHPILPLRFHIFPSISYCSILSALGFLSRLFVFVFMPNYSVTAEAVAYTNIISMRDSFLNWSG